MSFVISFVLACVAILATFMLQLCDDDLNRGSTAISVFSFFGIIAALYFVDYKKKFSLSKTGCNVLVILAVIVQIGALVRSRQDFLAFAIANILASLQTILFFQSKTLRKCYQIVTISFIEVAVGCVFQRSSLFVVSLPIFAILGFVCYSLLFQWSERKFYAERVVLKRRFSGSSNLSLITAEEPLHAPEYKPLDSFDSAAAAVFGRKATRFDQTRFFRRPSTFPILFNLEFFNRFAIGSLVAFVIGSVFFCVFPRLDEFGFGAIQFNDVNWQSGQGGRTTRTGFKSQIELGDLGPALDSKEAVMKIRLVDLENRIIDTTSPIYLRGVCLANYENRVWSEPMHLRSAYTVRDLRNQILASSITDPNYIMGALTSLNHPYAQNQTDYRFNSSNLNENTFRPPVMGTQPQLLREAFQSGFFKDSSDLADLVNLVNQENDANSLDYLKYDLRNTLVAFDVDLMPLDTNALFVPNPIYFAKSDASVRFTQSFSFEWYTPAGAPRAPRTPNFWFVSPAFNQQGRHASIVPNQEIAWPFVGQYLAIDQERFPNLVRIAKEWDEKSQLPKEDFVGRARFIESQLRDSGEFKYDRVGSARNPEIDPIEDFFTEHKSGHCEYFAGALALALRAVGIPSRVAVGYVCYPAENGKEFTVRQSDAHSWVEAFIPSDKLPKPTDSSAYLYAGSSTLSDGSSAMPQNRDWSVDGAWLRLDATPAADRDADRPNAIAISIFAWSNLFRSFGRDFVLNFNGVQQMRMIYEPITNVVKKTIHFLKELREGLKFIDTMVARGKALVRSVLNGEWTPNVVFAVCFIVSVFILATYAVAKLVRLVLARIKDALEQSKINNQRRLKKLRGGEIALIYEKLELALETKFKITRRASETQREFVERCFEVDDELLRKSDVSRTNVSEPTYTPIPSQERQELRALVEAYYQRQFGDKTTSAENSSRWFAVLRNANLGLN